MGLYAITIKDLHDVPVVVVTGLVTAAILKFSDLLKAFKEIFHFFKFNRKKKFIISDEERYLNRRISGRFGMTFIEITKWHRVIPYNGGGCSFTNPKDTNVVYTVSGHFSGMDHDDTLDLYTKNLIKIEKNHDKSIVLHSSNVTSCDLVDLNNGTITKSGSIRAQHLEYSFKGKNGTKIRASERVMLYMGTAVRIYFQSPSSKYANYEELRDYLFSQYFVLNESSAPNTDRKRR